MFSFKELVDEQKMGNEFLDLSTGKLKKKLLPAIYFDSTVLIDYWVTEGMEFPDREPEFLGLNEPSYFRIIQDILKSDQKISKVVEIRKKLLFEKIKAYPVITPLAICELMKWHSESILRQFVSEVAGAKRLQRMSEKEFGDMLKKVYKQRESEIKERQVKTRKGSMESKTGAQSIIEETMINPSFAIAHGLDGLLLVDIVNLNMQIGDIWRFGVFPYLQLGLGDVMHIILAHHLGCQYFASWDSDFGRVADILQEEMKIELLNSPEKILAIL